MCNDLAGRYRKDFKRAGRHSNDLCYAVPIIQGEKLKELTITIKKQKGL